MQIVKYTKTRMIETAAGPEELEPGWWLDDVPSDVSPVGPYSTKAEAEEALRGLKRFFDREMALKPGAKGAPTT